MPSTRQQPNNDWNIRFVDAVMQRCQQDKGLAARLRRADNPATEYQSWDFLARHGVDLEKPWQRLPFMTVAASVAKAQVEHNGSLKLGQAIALCYDKGRDNDQAVAKLRRLLACQELAEVCRILRPLLTLIASRVAAPLDYVTLLGQLRRFGFYGESVKTQWAQAFYEQPQAAARSQDEATA